MEELAIIIALFSLLVSIAVTALVGAVMLRATVSLFNKMAGSSESTRPVKEPTPGTATAIALIALVTNGIVGAMLAFCFGGITGIRGLSEIGVAAIGQLAAMPISILAMAIAISDKLSTTLGRAIAIGACFMLIMAVVVAGVGVVIILAMGYVIP